MFVRSLEQAAALAAAARPELAEADLRLPTADRLGTAAGRRRDRLLPLDCLEGAQAGRHLAAAAACAGASQQLRMALPRRSAAHGHQRVRPLPTAGPPRHRRPHKPGPPASRRQRHRARNRRRPLTARLRRDPQRPTGCHRRCLPRARPRLLPQPRHHGAPADDRQRLAVRAQRGSAGSSTPTASDTSRHGPTGRAPTARSNASTKRWHASGPTDSPTNRTTTAGEPCHTGSSTTTTPDRTARSAGYPRSAAFTTSVGRTSPFVLDLGLGR